MLFAMQWQNYHALKILSLPQCLQAVHNVSISRSSSSSILTSSQQKREQSSALTDQLKYAAAVILRGVCMHSSCAFTLALRMLQCVFIALVEPEALIPRSPSKLLLLQRLPFSRWGL